MALTRRGLLASHILCRFASHILGLLASQILRRKLPTLSLLLLAVLSSGLVLLAPGARAATTWQVSPGGGGACTQADANCGSIQAAVNAASGGDTIQVAAGTYAEHVVIGKDLTVGGAGAGQTIVDGTDSGTVFIINTSTSVSLSGITVTNGKAQSDSPPPCNPASCGGGIFNSGTLTLTGSTVSGNSAGISRNFDGSGGGIWNEGTMTLTGSIVSNNSAPGTGIGGGIVNDTGRTLTITDSTVSNNLAGHGGGVFTSVSTTLTVISSTISSNASTISAGGGISNSGGDGSLRLRSSIVAGNTSPDSPDISGGAISQGHNLVGISDGSHGLTGGTNGDIVGTASAPVDAMLRRLGNYGGPTQTQLPLPMSPVIDAGGGAVLDFPPFSLATDQRGFARKVGAHSDIGAVEFNPTTDVPGGDFQFNSNIYTVSEGGGHVDITVTRTGQITQAATVDFATADNDLGLLLPCSQVSGSASSRCDYEATSGTLQFAPGDSFKTFTVLVNDDSFVEGTERAKLILSNPTGDSAVGAQSRSTLEIDDNDATTPTTNLIDDAQFFVAQHYRDFLSREPDASGLNFWTGGITNCGSDSNCTAVKRVDTSAAFFLSIEFQDTGYLVERIYKVAFGDADGSTIFPSQQIIKVPFVRLREFLRDTRTVGQNVVVGQGQWQQQLADNKAAFALAFVHRADFLARYPFSMSAAAFVNALDTNAGGVLTSEEKAELMGELAPTNEHPPGPSDFALRADVLQKIADNAVLQQQEKSRAFVLMQYFGYLQRNPNDPPDADYTGYNFWLSKLNQFGGNFVQAEMVKAFITSNEYRQRFGP